MVALSVVDLVVSWDASTAVLLVVPMVVLLSNKNEKKL